MVPVQCSEILHQSHQHSSHRNYRRDCCCCCCFFPALLSLPYPPYFPWLLAGNLSAIISQPLSLRKTCIRVCADFLVRTATWKPKALYVLKPQVSCLHGGFCLFSFVCLLAFGGGVFFGGCCFNRLEKQLLLEMFGLICPCHLHLLIYFKTFRNHVSYLFFPLILPL